MEHPRGLAAMLVATVLSVLACSPSGREEAATETRVTIESGGWRLVGDLEVPQAASPTAAVILLPKAAGDRTVYAGLAQELARNGIASLRLDLRGHGESTNLGRFVPAAGTAILDGSEQDVVAAVKFMRSESRIDAGRIGVVGASYSGEVMMEAARMAGFGAAYVALSPGSLSGRSIAAIDRERRPFLLVVAREDRFLTAVTTAVREQSRRAVILEFGGAEHATDLLAAHSELAALIVEWIRQALGQGS